MKRRNWYFFALTLFPLVAFITMTWGATGDGHISDIIYGTPFQEWMQQFEFPPFSSLLNNVLDRAFSYTMSSAITSYISYLIVLTFVKICYEVIVFLPKFVGSLFERRMKE